MKHWKNIVLPLLLAPLLTTGCIKDDYDDCDNVAICFQYLADGNTNVLSQYIDHVDLYVFDEGGHLIDTRPYTREQLGSSGTTPSFKLTPGSTYHVVAVGNAGDYTTVEGLGSSDCGHIYIESPEWGTASAVTNHDHVYLGSRDFTVPSGNFTVLRDTVTLYSSHINTRIEVRGLPAPGDDGTMPISVSFEQSNGQTSFDNEVNPEAKGTCTPQLTYDAESGCYCTGDFTLYRMDEHGTLSPELCRHEVVVRTASGRELARFSLYDFLEEHTRSIDVTRQEAFLPIEIDFETGIIIKLPAWYIDDVHPGWQ